MPQLEKRDMPILGIEYEEEFNGDTSTKVGYYGPCTSDGCDSLSWLSEKRGEYLCGSCFYGPTYEPDPIVDDIRTTLQSTWWDYSHMVAEIIGEGSDTYHIIPASEPDISEVICPQCLESVDSVKLSAFEQWACTSCIEIEQAKGWA